jgi:hypothetical protein
LVKLDQATQAEMLKERNRVAQPEPSTGGSALPSGASDAQIKTAAEETAKRIYGEGWDNLPGNEKQARIVTQANKLYGGARHAAR